MRLLTFRRRQNVDMAKASNDPKSRPLGTPLTPLPPYRAHLRAKTFSETSLLSPCLTRASFQSDETQAASKSELLSHALHLARLAVILDRAEVYTGAARAYYDCCFLLASVEPLLARIESDITHQISKSYKKRLAFLSALAPISAGNTLQFPLDISPAPEYHVHLSGKAIQPTQLAELNRLCQFLRTLGHCTQIIQNLESESRSAISKSVDRKGLLCLSSEFQRLQEDITRFRGYYSKEDLVSGAASNILYVLLGSFRRKIANLVKSGDKQLILFLLALFDIRLPSECEAESKPLPPQPLNITKPPKREPIYTGARPPLTPGPTMKFANSIPETAREAVRLAPAPIPRKSSKRRRNRGEARKKPMHAREVCQGEEKSQVASRETFYLP
ncbi:hypothetical protein TWF696_006965 [Orbilia brochopaga]|uniref:Uncharacterized protein n=1 Tax=Orbilia brochopaga TaxID=3140254 RepID=A0AAV9USX7_9PEZI